VFGRTLGGVNTPPFRKVDLRGLHPMLAGDALARVRVIEAELVAAVMAHGHGHRSEMYDLNLVWMTAACGVRVVTTVHGGQRGPDDRVWTVRCHLVPIGTTPTTA
jgi:hypothetical protein